MKCSGQYVLMQNHAQATLDEFGFIQGNPEETLSVWPNGAPAMNEPTGISWSGVLPFGRRGLPESVPAARAVEAFPYRSRETPRQDQAHEIPL